MQDIDKNEGFFKKPGFFTCTEYEAIWLKNSPMFMRLKAS